MAIVQLAGIRATHTIIRQETSGSMKFAVLGWNFRKTHLEIRERLALSYEQQLALIPQDFTGVPLSGVGCPLDLQTGLNSILWPNNLV